LGQPAFDGFIPPVTAETAITFVTVCKGRLAHLKQSLPAAAAQAPCVVVDYACPDGTAAWVSANHPAVTVVRIEPGGSFSVAAGRNAGAAAAATDWLCFLDADVVPAPHFVEAVTPLLQSGQYYRPWPLTQDSWGAVLCTRSEFARVGGYDEAFEEWGGEDDDLYQRLQATGVRPAQYPGHLLSTIAHDDTMRMQFHSVKDREISRRINFAYMGLKTDVRAITGSEPEIQLRKALFAELRRVLSSSLRTGGEGRISMTLPDGELLPGWTATRTLVYSFPACALTPPAIGSGTRA
jgi:glycosyltransferase involved in cell wall biosynthesis